VKKFVLYGLAIFFLVGCGSYYIPIRGNLDDSTKKGLRQSATTANLAINLDKGLSEKFIKQKSKGATCGHAETQIPFGPALKEAMVEGLSTSFPNMMLVEKPEKQEGSYLIKITPEKIDIGFEFSVHGGCVRSMMDQGEITLSLKTEIVDPKGKNIFDETFDYKERAEDQNIPPVSQTGVLNTCVNKIVLKYMGDLKKSLKEIIKAD